MDDLVTARFDYSRLDVPGSAVRLRLSSTVVSLKNGAGDLVDVGYTGPGGLRRVHSIMRRLDYDFCDPLERRSDSALGIPGLLGALRP